MSGGSLDAVYEELGSLAVKCMSMAFSLQYDWYTSVDHDGSAPMDEKLEADIDDLIKTGKAVYGWRGVIKILRDRPEGLSEHQLSTIQDDIDTAKSIITEIEAIYPTILGECK